MKPKVSAAQPSASQSKALHCQSDECLQRRSDDQTAKRSVTRMSDTDPEDTRKMSLTQTPN